MFNPTIKHQATDLISWYCVSLQHLMNSLTAAAAAVVA
jgi:hypothetical protein